MKRNWKRKIPLVILLGIGAMAAFSGVVMLLWNNILPGVLHAGMITFWQAAGLLLLARLLFGFRGRGRHFGGCRGREAYGWQRYSEPQPVVSE